MLLGHHFKTQYIPVKHEGPLCVGAEDVDLAYCKLHIHTA